MALASGIEDIPDTIPRLRAIWSMRFVVDGSEVGITQMLTVVAVRSDGFPMLMTLNTRTHCASVLLSGGFWYRPVLFLTSVGTAGTLGFYWMVRRELRTDACGYVGDRLYGAC